MARTHPRRLAAAGIDEHRLTELKAICRQYWACRRRLAMARAGIVDRTGNGGAWRRPDPTGNAAIRLAGSRDARRVKVIESAAAKVAEPVVARALLRYVAEGVGYEYQDPKPPVGRNQFYVIALLFYIELDRLLEDG